jgi:oligopeptide transport system substrate-binding protein
LDKIPGFRSPTDEDLARAKQLLSDAGFPDCKGMPMLEIPTRDLPDARILVPAVQAMLKQNLGCESETAIHQTSAIAEVTKAGDFHIIPSTMGSHGVPGSAGGAALKKCDEPNNTIRYCNREFDKVVDAFLVETDPQKANELKLQIRDFWDADWPWVPYGETPIQYGWYDYVMGWPTFSVSTYEKNLHKLDWVWTTKSR